MENLANEASSSPLFTAANWGYGIAAVVLVNRLVLRLRKQSARSLVGGAKSGDEVASQIFFAPNPPRMRDTLFEDTEGDVENPHGEGARPSMTGRPAFEKAVEAGEKDDLNVQNQPESSIQEVTRSRIN